MSTATVRLNDHSRLALDAVMLEGERKAILMTMQGQVHGSDQNCCLIPLDRVRAVIASLELVSSKRNVSYVPLP